MTITQEDAQARLEKVKSDRASKKSSHRHHHRHSRKKHSSSEEKKQSDQAALLELEPELRSILVEIGLEQYVSIFLAHNVKTSSAFHQLTDKELKSMGLSSRSRTKILEYLLEHSRSEISRMSLSLATPPTPSPIPTPTPTSEPISQPTPEPTVEPTVQPTVQSTPEPTVQSTVQPTPEPTPEPKKDDRFLAQPAVELFHRYDVDKSGGISLSELQDALTDAGFEFSEFQLEMILLSVDADSNGNLNLDEFTELFEQLNFLETFYECEILVKNKTFEKNLFRTVTVDLGLHFNDFQMETLYEFADSDKSGTISREEFLTIGLFLRLSRALFRRADLNKNGSLDFNEVFKILPVILPNSASTEKFVVRSIFNNIDRDRDNALSVEEFVHLVATIKMN